MAKVDKKFWISIGISMFFGITGSATFFNVILASVNWNKIFWIVCFVIAVLSALFVMWIIICAIIEKKQKRKEQNLIDDWYTKKTGNSIRS